MTGDLLRADRCAACHLRPTWAGDGSDEPLCWECAVERAAATPLPGSCDLCGERHGRRVSCAGHQARADGVTYRNPEGRGGGWATPTPRMPVTACNRDEDEWAS